METKNNKIGFVYFVGAGPYDPDLITIKGVNAIKQADVVVYDYLANNKLLGYAKEDAQKIYVGKKARNHTMKQEDINQLLVDKAKEGYCVVRLKGGDPYVFGRGGEEAEILYNNNIKFEVIPGISSSIAAPAYAGIPLTFRNIARSFHVLTGHDIEGYRKWNWEALVRLEGTLVFLMSIGSLKTIMQSLMEAGQDRQTPTAVIRWGSSPKQKTVVGTVENIYERVIEHKITPPGIIVVGDVVHKREILSTFENKILHGKRILVTRARQQKSKFCKMLSDMGADVVEIPTIKIKHLQPEQWECKNSQKIDIDNLQKITWIVITSANGVKSFMEGLFSLGYDARALFNVKIACIGSETQRVLAEYGIKADLIPERAISESMAGSLEKILTNDDRVMIVCGNLAKDIIKNRLCEICHVEELTVYNTLIDDGSEELLQSALDEGLDAMAFTSGSTADNLAELLKRIKVSSREDIAEDLQIEYCDNIEFPKVPCFSIGPKTSKALKKYTDNIYETDDISIEGLVDCIAKNLKGIR